MKKIILVYIIVMLSDVCIAGTLKVDSLIIRFMTWDNDDSPHIVTPNMFEYDVPYKEYIIDNVTSIEKVRSLIKDAQVAEYKEFNVGCKLFFTNKKGEHKVIALNGKYIFMDGLTYKCPYNLKVLIDELMYKNAQASENKYDYMPDKYGDEYINGRAGLNKKLSSFFKKYSKLIDNGHKTNLIAYCKASREGKTTEILGVKISNEGLSEKEKDYLRKDIERSLYKLKWKKDVQRMKADIITIIYKHPTGPDVN